MVIRLLLLVCGLCVAPIQGTEKLYTLEEAHGLSDFLRAGDKRLIRDRPNDASFLRTGNFCEGLDSYIATIQRSDDPDVKYYAADVLTTCLIHRKENQDAVGLNPHFHQVVVEFLKEEPHAAAELIWAATENNSINLNGFIEANAIEELVRVIQYYENSVAAMWSAAALMNMSTSYCGRDEGPCIWKWADSRRLKPTRTVDVDGLIARLQIMELDGVYDLLHDQVCSSVAFADLHGVVLPTAAVRPVDAHSLVPWAMAGLIKTLALRKVSHVHLEATVPCLCMLSYSDDALERRHAWEALYNLGREGACHTEDIRRGVCVDMPFSGGELSSCTDLRSTGDCIGQLDGTRSVEEACCICGGGNNVNNAFMKQGIDDL